jgi:hypothetical protein
VNGDGETTMELQYKPPLDIEQALDLVLAAAAHRSSNDKHSEFGTLIINEYFVRLRENYKNDPVATLYMDNLMSAAASAIHAFSVERDLFQTRWHGFVQQHQYEIERANKLDDYSPFKEKGIWGKAISLAGGAGLGAVLGEVVQQYAIKSGLFLLGVITAGAVISLILFDVFLNLYRDRRLSKAALDFPTTLEADWRARSLVTYRVILKQFLLSAIKIREEFYPDLPTLSGERLFSRYQIPHIQFALDTEPKTELGITDEIDATLDQIVERHFAFKPREEVKQ